MPAETAETSPDSRPDLVGSVRAGVLVAFAAQRPVLRAITLPPSGHLTVGRESTDLPVADDQVSRQHAELSFDGSRWMVRDLGSRNGTFVDGVRIDAAIIRETVRVVRVGGTILLPVADVRRYELTSVNVRDGRVVGPKLREALRQVETCAAAGENVLITGESGCGKEGAAQAFHAAGPHAQGPFVPLNCAAIPKGLVESTLFGAKKGAYTGSVSDTQGQVVAADGGVLFLDELGELDLEVQAKLLRLIETREVVPVGATTARKVDVKFCFATHRDLRLSAGANKFRADLFYRISQPHVRLPPLRDRPEEIPWLLQMTVRQVDASLGVSTSLVETCLSRPWPGNIRELISEAMRAARAARMAGSRLVRAEHIDPEAGTPLGAADHDPRPPGGTTTTREMVERALQANDGNVSKASRALGIHRTQLYRLMKRFGVAVPP